MYTCLGIYKKRIESFLVSFSFFVSEKGTRNSLIVRWLLYLKDKCIGIDIGGTSIKLAFLKLDGMMLAKWEIPTDISYNGVKIVGDIIETVNKKIVELNFEMDSFNEVGVGVPGFVDSVAGCVTYSPNIPWKENYPLKEELEEGFRLPVAIENDANLAAIGEMWMGAGKGKKNILMVTLGTGVGGGVIVDGEVVRGINGMGGEIGHIFSKDNGIICGCGKVGCLETIASATGMVRLGNEMIENHSGSTDLYVIKEDNGKIEAKDVLNAAESGDFYALNVVDEAMKHLGIAISTIIHTNNPEMVIIGGGVSKAGEFLLEQLKKYLKQYTLPRAYHALTLELASLGNDAGVVGGAYLYKGVNNKVLNV